jgi:NhaA family Na+:H+ antiporter
VSEAATVTLDPPPMDADHVLGDANAELTLVEYGSFNCPSCLAAHDVIANLRDHFGDRLRYVFRHRPLTGNEDARRAAELAEFAHQTSQNYWEAHDALIRRGPYAGPREFAAVTAELGLPVDEPARADAWHRAKEKVERDMQSARVSGARVSPTFFINGRRYEGAWDETALTEALLGSLGHRVQTAALDFARWAPSTGLLLLVMTAAAIGLTNSEWSGGFTALWESQAGFMLGDWAFQMPLRAWINDGLLTIFFLVVGLEIKREFTVGRLASPRAAALPFAAAAGGMLLPAALYLAIVPAGPLAAGWAIPTTTDTAFAVALIALLGTRVPVELRIFLTAAVVVDDLVAIVIVALFYSSGLDYHFLAFSAALAVLLVMLNRSGVYAALPYGLIGIILWGALHASGLHATLAGVILAIVTPTRPPPNLRVLVAQAETLIDHELRRAGEQVLRHGPSDETLRSLDAIHDRIESPAAKLLRSVEPWSSYVVLPVFALANAGLALEHVTVAGHESLIAAIIVGLVIGKPLGMLAGAALAARAGIATKPDAYSWMQLLGAGALAGIGFTMSLYIGAKAFPDGADYLAAKIGIFLASIIAGALGCAILRTSGRSLP